MASQIEVAGWIRKGKEMEGVREYWLYFLTDGDERGERKACALGLAVLGKEGAGAKALWSTQESASRLGIDQELAEAINNFHSQGKAALEIAEMLERGELQDAQE